MRCDLSKPQDATKSAEIFGCVWGKTLFH